MTTSNETTATTTAATNNSTHTRTYTRNTSVISAGRCGQPHPPPTLVDEVAADLALELHPQPVQLVEPVGDWLAVPAEGKV